MQKEHQKTQQELRRGQKRPAEEELPWPWRDAGWAVPDKPLDELLADIDAANLGSSLKKKAIKRANHVVSRRLEDAASVLPASPPPPPPPPPAPASRLSWLSAVFSGPLELGQCLGPDQTTGADLADRASPNSFPSAPPLASPGPSSFAGFGPLSPPTSPSGSPSFAGLGSPSLPSCSRPPVSAPTFASADPSPPRVPGRRRRGTPVVDPPSGSVWSPDEGDEDDEDDEDDKDDEQPNISKGRLLSFGDLSGVPVEISQNEFLRWDNEVKVKMMAAISAYQELQTTKESALYWTPAVKEPCPYDAIIMVTRYSGSNNTNQHPKCSRIVNFVFDKSWSGNNFAE